MDIQALMDGMNAKWQRERAETQITLGKLIAALEAMPGNQLVDGIRGPHSYRGYYSDLAFDVSGNRITAADALKMCRDAMGQVFEGYKGGDYMMGASTPLWIASYGMCGARLMSLDPQTGVIATAPEED